MVVYKYRVMNILFAFFLIIICPPFTQPQLASVRYVVGKPTYICEKEGKIKETNSTTTKIILPKDETAVYNVFFQKVCNECNTQRYNILFWNTVRNFERFLNTKYSKTNNGVISFNNSMLVSGIRYLINVSMRRRDYSIHDFQVILDMADKNYKKSMKKPLASVFVTAPLESYVFSDTLVTSEASICSKNITGFYFQWSVLDFDHNLVRTFSEKSTELLIPANIFSLSGKKYKIICELIDIENIKSIANNSVEINIRDTPKKVEESLSIQLSCQHTTVNSNSHINVHVYIFDAVHSEDPVEIKWKCSPEDINYLCKDETGPNLTIEDGFSKTNNYTITAEVTNKKLTKSSNCIIIVRDDVPSIELNIVTFPIRSINGLELIADVDGLRTFCSIRWSSTDINLSQLPGDNLGKEFNVTVTGDHFLSELEDFSEDTISKKYKLTIPSPSRQWEGLKNQPYHFLLTISCPIIQDLTDNSTYMEFHPEHFNTITASVRVDVLNSPVLGKFKVKPDVGVAFDTLFNFQIEVLNGNIPFLYKFGYEYVGDNLEIIFGMSNTAETSSRLPFNEQGIQTFVIVCDFINSCSKKYGPLLRLTLPKKEVIDISKVGYKFTFEMNTEDYYKAFSFAVAVLRTTKYLGTEKEYNEYFLERINTKITKLFGGEVDNVNKFLNYLSIFSSYLTLSEDILNNLIKLRTELSKSNDSEKLITQRRLLIVNDESCSINKVKNDLDISEMIISSSKDKTTVNNEKKHVLNTLKDCLPKICADIFENKNRSVKLELKTVLISVEKLSKKIIGSYLVVPFEKNIWNTTGRLKLLDKSGIEENDSCLVKMAFKNYFEDSNTIIFGADIINWRISEKFRNVTNIVLLPTQLQTDDIECEVSNNDIKFSCKLLKTSSKYGQFQCPILGNYFIKYKTETKMQFDNSVAESLPITNGPSYEDRNNISMKSNNFTIKNTNNYEVISYVVTVSSVIGIGILCYILKKISTGPTGNITLDENHHRPQYANLLEEETLY